MTRIPVASSTASVVVLLTIACPHFIHFINIHLFLVFISSSHSSESGIYAVIKYIFSASMLTTTWINILCSEIPRIRQLGKGKSSGYCSIIVPWSIAQITSSTVILRSCSLSWPCNVMMMFSALFIFRKSSIEYNDIYPFLEYDFLLNFAYS